MMRKFPVLLALAVLLPVSPIVQAKLRDVAPTRTASADEPKGLHIPQGPNVNFNWEQTDGKGFRWDIQTYGTVGSGTNNAYGGGMYCQIQGSNINSSGRAWMNKDGDEIQIGPFNWSNQLQCFRRVKVYKDRGLVRWLDIFQNTTAADVTVPIQYYTNYNYGITSATYSSAGAAFTDKDWWFATQTSNQQSPAVLHIVAGPKARLRPQVQMQTGNSNHYVQYQLSIPAGQTVVLCHFESQAASADDHQKAMKRFRPYQVLKDLPAEVRKMILNWSVTGLDTVELDRSDVTDVVLLKGGDRIAGTITNESYRVQTFFGPLQFSAADVIGMAAGKGQGANVLFALKDGQVVTGQVDGLKIHVKLNSGSTLKIPVERTEQWSYRISKDRPDEAEFAGPVAILRTGDRLAFDAGKLKVHLQTRYGQVDLAGAKLLEIRMDNGGNQLHQVTFRNTSRLAGLLEPRQLVLDLKLGQTLQVPRDMVALLQFATEDAPDESLSKLQLANGDELFGRLAEPVLTISTEYSDEPVEIKTANARAVAFSPTHLGRAAVQMWDTTILRGELAPRRLRFAIEGGPTLSVYSGEVVQLLRTQALPPDELIKRVEELVAQLGAESHKDRQDATQALKEMGGAIVPLLKKHLDSGDPEVRHRLRQIIEEVEPANPSQPNAMPPPAFWGVLNCGPMVGWGGRE